MHFMKNCNIILLVYVLENTTDKNSFVTKLKKNLLKGTIITPLPFHEVR